MRTRVEVIDALSSDERVEVRLRLGPPDDRLLFHLIPDPDQRMQTPIMSLIYVYDLKTTITDAIDKMVEQGSTERGIFRQFLAEQLFRLQGGE